MAKADPRKPRMILEFQTGTASVAAPEYSNTAAVSFNGDATIFTFAYADPFGTPIKVDSDGTPTFAANRVRQIALPRASFRAVLVNAISTLKTLDGRDEYGWSDIVRLISEP